jgi:hypothetical protein
MLTEIERDMAVRAVTVAVFDLRNLRDLPMPELELLRDAYSQLGRYLDRMRVLEAAE